MIIIRGRELVGMVGLREESGFFFVVGITSVCFSSLPYLFIFTSSLFSSLPAFTQILIIYTEHAYIQVSILLNILSGRFALAFQVFFLTNL